MYPLEYAALDFVCRITWLSVESKDPTAIPSSVTNKKCFPSGKKEGQRWLCSAADCLVVVTGTGVPPLSGTLYSGSFSPGVNTITPSWFHVPPRPAGASQQNLHHSARRWNALQLSVGEKAEIFAVARPKRIRGAVSTLQRLSSRGIQRADENNLLALAVGDERDG